MNRGLNAASQDHGCSSLGNQGWGFCECFWREIVGEKEKIKRKKERKKGVISINRLDCCEITWKNATDEKFGDPCLPEKNDRHTHECLLSQSFSS